MDNKPASKTKAIKKDKNNVQKETRATKTKTQTTPDKKVLTFITGNAKKLEEVVAILGNGVQGIEFKNQALDLAEMQGTPEQVATAKARLAAEQCDGPVFVEDTSLCFNAYKGLPGVYIKYFLENVGTQGLYQMVKAFDDQTGYAQCTFAYCKGKGHEPITFVGRTEGTIV